MWKFTSPADTIWWAHQIPEMNVEGSKTKTKTKKSHWPASNVHESILSSSPPTPGEVRGYNSEYKCNTIQVQYNTQQNYEQSELTIWAPTNLKIS